MLISIKDLYKTYPMGNVNIQALKGINLSIAEGDFVCVAGPSGSGKSTLLNMIGLIDSFDAGSLNIDNIEIHKQKEKELAALRSGLIGFVFQSFNLLPVLSVYENVGLPLVISQKKINKKNADDRVNYLIKAVGLEKRAKHLPAQLSGGEQQRVSIARALVTSPKIIIADEPTGNLDSKNAENILKLMKDINIKEKTTFIFSTHDEKIWKMADHTIFLQDGIIKEEKRLNS